MQIPLLDLKPSYEKMRQQILAAVADVLDSQRCIGGPKIKQLEERIAAYYGCKYAVGVSSGTDALLVSLMSLDIGPGDEVITTPFTFFATVGAIVRVGAKPVFADIDPKTFNIDPAKISGAITKKTKAIIPVHLYGQMCDMDAILEIAGKHRIEIIEDAAQSFGAKYKGKYAGASGKSVCLSFYPSKNLPGIGDGGMVLTNDADFYNRLIVMRDHGQNPQYYYKYVGGNFRLDAINAAAMLVRLDYVGQWLKRRAENAAYYDRAFRNSPVAVPYRSADCEHTFNQYVIRVQRRNELAEHLKKNHIGCAIYYPLCLHQQQCFESLGYKKGDFPQSENAADEVLAIPVYPDLTKEMQDYVIRTILEFV